MLSFMKCTTDVQICSFMLSYFFQNYNKDGETNSYFFSKKDRVLYEKLEYAVFDQCQTYAHNNIVDC